MSVNVHTSNSDDDQAQADLNDAQSRALDHVYNVAVSENVNVENPDSDGMSTILGAADKMGLLQGKREQIDHGERVTLDGLSDDNGAFNFRTAIRRCLKEAPDDRKRAFRSAFVLVFKGYMSRSADLLFSSDDEKALNASARAALKSPVTVAEVRDDRSAHGALALILERMNRSTKTAEAGKESEIRAQVARAARVELLQKENTYTGQKQILAENAFLLDQLRGPQDIEAVIAKLGEFPGEQQFADLDMSYNNNLEKTEVDGALELITRAKTIAKLVRNDTDLCTLEPKFTMICQAYSDAVDQYNPAQTDFHNADDAAQFLREHYMPFVNYLNEFQKSAEHQLNIKKRTLAIEVDATEAELQRFGDFDVSGLDIPSILKDAFKGARSPVELQQLKSAHSTAKAAHEKLQTARDSLGKDGTSASLRKEATGLRTLFADVGLADGETLGQKREDLAAGIAAFEDAGNRKLPANTPGVPTAREAAVAREQLKQLDSIKERAKKLYEALTSVLSNLRVAADHGLTFEGLNLDSLEARLEAVNLDTKSFSPQSLLDIYDALAEKLGDKTARTLFVASFDERLGKTQSEMDQAETAVKAAEGASKDIRELSEPDYAHRILTAMVAHQYPDMNEAQCKKMATRIMMRDNRLLRMDPNEIANEAGLELTATIEDRLITQYIIGMAFEVDGKTQKPLKRFKSEVFSDVNKLRPKLAANVMTRDEVFYALAGFKVLEEKQSSEGHEVKYEQTKLLEEKAYELLAKQRKATDKLHNPEEEAKVAAKLKEALGEYMADAQGSNENYDASIESVNSAAVEMYVLEYEKILEEARIAIDKARRAGNHANEGVTNINIKRAEMVHNRKLKKLQEKAEAAGVKKEFMDAIQGKMLSDYRGLKMKERATGVWTGIKRWVAGRLKATGIETGKLTVGSAAKIGAATPLALASLIPGGMAATGLAAFRGVNRAKSFAARILTFGALGKTQKEITKAQKKTYGKLLGRLPSAIFAKTGASIKKSAGALSRNIKQVEFQRPTLEEISEFDRESVDEQIEDLAKKAERKGYPIEALAGERVDWDAEPEFALAS